MNVCATGASSGNGGPTCHLSLKLAQQACLHHRPIDPWPEVRPLKAVQAASMECGCSCCCVWQLSWLLTPLGLELFSPSLDPVT